jgi:hypothetical protein
MCTGTSTLPVFNMGYFSLHKELCLTKNKSTLWHVTVQVLNITLQGQNAVLWELKLYFHGSNYYTVIWDLKSGI